MSRHTQDVQLNISSRDNTSASFTSAQRGLSRLDDAATRVSKSMGGLKTGILAVGASVVGLGGASIKNFLKSVEQTEIIRNRISELGLTTKLTTSDIEAFGVSIGSLESANTITKMLLSGDGEIQQFGDRIIWLGGLFDNMAKVTGFSSEIQASNFSRSMFKQGKSIDISAKALKRLSRRLDLFSKDELKAIETSARLGKILEANATVVDRLDTRFGNISVSDIGAEFRSLSAAIDLASTKFGQFLAIFTKERLGVARALLEDVTEFFDAAAKTTLKNDLNSVDAEIKSINQQLSTGTNLVKGFWGKNSEPTLELVSDPESVNRLNEQLAIAIQRKAALEKTFSQVSGVGEVRDVTPPSTDTITFPPTRITGNILTPNDMNDGAVELFKKSRIEMLAINSGFASSSIDAFTNMSNASTEMELTAMALVINTAERRIQLSRSVTEIERDNITSRFNLERQTVQDISLMNREELVARLRDGDILSSAQREQARNLLRLRIEEANATQQSTFAQEFQFDLMATANRDFAQAIRTTGSAIGESLVKPLFDGGDAFENLEEVGKSAFRSIVTGLVNYGIQQAIQFALGEGFKAAATTSSVAQSGIITAAAAPAAITTSIATAGAAPVFGLASLTAAVLGGAALFASLDGQFHDGTESVPKTGSYLLAKGERVVKQAENKQLGKFLDSNTGRGNSQQPQIVNISFSATDTQGLREMVGRLSNEITRAVTTTQRHSKLRYSKG